MLKKIKNQVEIVFFADCEQHLLSYNQFDNFKFDCESLENRILRAFEELTQREVEVLTLHFGLFEHEEQTLKEIGLNMWSVQNKKIGVCQQTIRAIQEKALRKLRHPAKKHFFE